MGKIKKPLPRPMACDGCGSTHISLSENSVLYGRNYGSWPLIWFCRSCTAAVGCHPNTDVPLGLMADRATRQLRQKAHEAFDPLWKNTPWLTRHKAYGWLAKKMGLHIDHCHISWFDKNKCRKVIEICTQDKPNKRDFKPKPRQRR